MGKIRIVLIKYFLRHAISTTEIAAIRYGDAQVSEGAPSSIFGMAMRRDQLRANRRRQASAFVNADGDYLGHYRDYFFNHKLNYGCETGFLPNRQISFWDK